MPLLDFGPLAALHLVPLGYFREPTPRANDRAARLMGVIELGA